MPPGQIGDGGAAGHLLLMSRSVHAVPAPAFLAAFRSTLRFSSRFFESLAKSSCRSQHEIETCRLCLRLTAYREKVARERVRRFRDQGYGDVPYRVWDAWTPGCSSLDSHRQLTEAIARVASSPVTAPEIGFIAPCTALASRINLIP